jgi:nicotinate-nucleotide adenylyltransferase
MARSGAKIGLLGGTFDPPHLAHLRIAEEARVAFQLSEVWFIPAGYPPHKERPTTPFEKRFEMLALSIQGNPYFKALDIERETFPSFTLKTLERLKATYPEPTFYLILGWDAYLEIDSWWHYEKFLDYVEIIVVSRGKGEWEGAPFIVKERAQSLWGKSEKVHFLEVFPLEISSTLLRRYLKEGKSIRYLVPEEVFNFISSHNLYRS